MGSSDRSLSRENLDGWRVSVLRPREQTLAMNNIIRLASLFFFCWIGHVESLAESPPADLIITNALVRTMDPERPVAEAIAITAGRIVAVGSCDDVAQRAGIETRTMDAGGHLILPGFNDAHVHFVSGGQQLSSVDSAMPQTLDEFRRRIEQVAAKLPAGTWITGGDWDHENWPGGPLPTRAAIDDVTQNIPSLLPGSMDTWDWPTRSRCGWAGSRARPRTLRAD